MPRFAEVLETTSYGFAVLELRRFFPTGSRWMGFATFESTDRTSAAPDVSPSEVGDFRLFLLIQQHIGRFQVTMNQAPMVCVCDGLADTLRDWRRFTSD